MKRFLLIAALLIALAVSALGQERWTGSYEFEEDGGKTSGGSAIVVVHEIDIIETDDGLIAEVRANGFQTSRALVAKVRFEGEKALLYFESYGDSNMLETFKEGELLLTLERKGDQILTTWGAYLPASDKFKKPGKVYFRKLKKVEE